MYYYLGYGSVSIVTLLLFFIYMYVLLSPVICCKLAVRSEHCTEFRTSFIIITHSRTAKEINDSNDSCI